MRLSPVSLSIKLSDGNVYSNDASSVIDCSINGLLINGTVFDEPIVMLKISLVLFPFSSVAVILRLTDPSSTLDEP